MGVKLAVPFVPAGVKDAVLFVPAGVNEAVPLVPAGVKLTLPFVPAGVPALTALVVPWLPVNAGVDTVPVGVMLFEPPVVPTSPLAAVVPWIITPLSASTSVANDGQVPLVIIKSIPEMETGVAQVTLTFCHVGPTVSI